MAEILNHQHRQLELRVLADVNDNSHSSNLSARNVAPVRAPLDVVSMSDEATEKDRAIYSAIAERYFRGQ